MLADPGFVVVEAIQMLKQFHVAFQCQDRVLAQVVERRHEDAAAQVRHWSLSHYSNIKSVTVAVADDASCSNAGEMSSQNQHRRIGKALEHRMPRDDALLRVAVG